MHIPFNAQPNDRLKPNIKIKKIIKLIHSQNRTIKKRDKIEELKNKQPLKRGIKKKTDTKANK